MNRRQLTVIGPQHILFPINPCLIGPLFSKVCIKVSLNLYLINLFCDRMLFQHKPIKTWFENHLVEL